MNEQEGYTIADLGLPPRDEFDFNRGYCGHCGTVLDEFGNCPVQYTQEEKE